MFSNLNHLYFFTVDSVPFSFFFFFQFLVFLDLAFDRFCFCQGNTFHFYIVEFDFFPMAFGFRS